MPTHRELLLSLRDDFEQLELFDQTRRYGLRQHARMVIEHVFGESSSYYEQLSTISFRRGGGVAIVSTSFGRGGETAEDRRARERAWHSGQQQSISLIDTTLKDLELREPEQVQSGEESTGPRSNRVFVVHGHDGEMRESVARVLTRLGLEPVILHELPDRGRKIIEKFYEHSDVGFAVVLLSPDDIGYAEAEGADAAQPRARQNVILELGFFLGKLGRDRVVALHKGSVDIPTDYSGVLFKPYVSGGDWPYQLTRELIAGGYDVDANKLFRRG